jgi:hypothetical protein
VHHIVVETRTGCRGLEQPDPVDEHFLLKEQFFDGLFVLINGREDFTFSATNIDFFLTLRTFLRSSEIIVYVVRMKEFLSRSIFIAKS